MVMILTTVLVYLLALGVNYRFYVKQKSTSNDVTRRTSLVFMAASALLAALFWREYNDFLINIKADVIFLAVLLALLLALANYMKESNYLLQINDRSNFIALNSDYILTKGAEILFTQLAFLLVIIGIVSISGYSLVSWIILIQVLVVIHTPFIIGSEQRVLYSASFALAITATIISFSFYNYGLLFPAMYLNSLLYVLHWAIFAEANLNANSG